MGFTFYRYETEYLTLPGLFAGSKEYNNAKFEGQLWKLRYYIDVPGIMFSVNWAPRKYY